MEANQLRLGNYVKFPHNEKPLTVSHTVIRYSFQDSNMYDPIVLNADWLIKFEFTHLGIGFVSLDDLLFVYAGNNEKYEIFLHKEIEEDVYLAHIQYVHQLQNLYFALTGKELTL